MLHKIYIKIFHNLLSRHNNKNGEYFDGVSIHSWCSCGKEVRPNWRGKLISIY